MRRRDFLRLAGGVGILWPVIVRGQTANRVRRIALLLGSSANDPEMQTRLAAFQEQLRALGWTIGDNVQIETRWFGGREDRAQSLAKELVERAPDVVVANGTPGIEAALGATRAIPTVFVMVGDPVGSGYVSSMAHPGANVTGFSAFDPEIAGKWMQLVKEAAPTIKRVIVLFYPGYEFLWRGAEAQAAGLGLEATQANCQSATDIQQAITALTETPASALVVLPTPLFATNRKLIVQLAAKRQLPAVYPFRYYAAAGGLMSYGIDAVDVFRRSARYVDRILKGEKPGELPVQAPTKFGFVINLKTAKALGLALPPTLLASADEVIE
jgi:putative ABC transport system substrate-binding protein